MKSGKSLATAYAIKRKKMACGGMAKKPKGPMHSAKGIAAAIKRKKMAQGGMVEPESEQDEFLTEDMENSDWDARDEMFSDDPDNDEAIDPKTKKSRLLSKVFANVQKRQTGR